MIQPGRLDRLRCVLHSDASLINVSCGDTLTLNLIETRERERDIALVALR